VNHHSFHFSGAVGMCRSAAAYMTNPVVWANVPWTPAGLAGKGSNQTILHVEGCRDSREVFYKIEQHNTSLYLHHANLSHKHRDRQGIAGASAMASLTTYTMDVLYVRRPFALAPLPSNAKKSLRGREFESATD
jgi:hypothetical protein